MQHKQGENPCLWLLGRPGEGKDHEPLSGVWADCG